MIHVGLCVPCTDVVQTFWAFDLARMIGHTTRVRPDIELCQFFFPGSLIPKQREGIVKEMLPHNITHALWLDTDMRFPPDTLLRLLDRKERIVGANYTTRKDPYLPIAFPDLHHAHERVFTTPESTGLEAVQALGFGCVMVDMNVFRTLPEPWFCVTWNPDTKVYMGEDVWFCCQAREHGETVWLDHDLSKEVKHIGNFEFTTDHAIQAREQRDAHAQAVA